MNWLKNCRIIWYVVIFTTKIVNTIKGFFNDFRNVESFNKRSNSLNPTQLSTITHYSFSDWLLCFLYYLCRTYIFKKNLYLIFSLLADKKSFNYTKRKNTDSFNEPIKCRNVWINKLDVRLLQTRLLRTYLLLKVIKKLTLHQKSVFLDISTNYDILKLF